ncbi:MAG: hypothetical protein KDI30_05755 [Pseudomonadales bacterium]|nr:hypothetical protein [Pseudomonadales bacterium]
MKTPALTKPVLALFVIALLTLQGCGTPVPFQYSYQPSGITPAFTLEDARPAADLGAKSLSLIITSDNYGIFRLADNEVQPDKIQFLRDSLSRQQQRLPASSSIVVRRFAVYNNLQQVIKRNNNIGFLTGPLGVAGDISLNPGQLPAAIMAELEFTLAAASTSPATCQAKTGVPYVVDKKTGPNRAEVENAILAAMQQVIELALQSCLPE